MSKSLYIMVSVPAADYWPSRFGISLAGLMAGFSRQVPGYTEQRLALAHKSGSILPQLRNGLVEQALQAEATHVLFLDCDQTFPSNLLHRMLAWGKRVVACNVATKRFPSTPTARLYQAGSRGGKLLYTEPDSKGLVRVWRVGTGVMLLETSVFKDIKRPWFEYKWLPEENDYQGEDWTFCEKLDWIEEKIWVDQELSYEIGHYGGVEYKHDFVIASRDMGEHEGVGERLVVTPQ